MSSPLGAYATIVTALVAVGVIAAAVFAHLFLSHADSFVDSLALLGAGVIFGSAAASNGTHAEVKALHQRVDAIVGPGTPGGTE